MRFAVLSWAFLLAVSCSPVLEREAAVLAERPLPTAPTLAPVPAKPPMPSSAEVPPRLIRGAFTGITFEGVSFDARSHRLVVIDQAGGPGRFADAAAAARSVGGLAAVNGGFFTPEGEPLGLVIAAGKRSGSWNTASSLGSGVWHDSDTSAISRREKLGRARASSMRELLQAGPMLVENGHTVAGLDSVKVSVRTLILWDGGSRWWIGRSTPASLAQTAAALVNHQIPGWPVRHALNLDGGRSSELWVSPRLSGGPLTRRPPWNRPVRNFLVLLPAR